MLPGRQILANVCGWLASLFPLQVQEEIWGSDPDTVVTQLCGQSLEVDVVGHSGHPTRGP